jgi:hypothetical protein
MAEKFCVIRRAALLLAAAALGGTSACGRGSEAGEPGSTRTPSCAVTEVASSPANADFSGISSLAVDSRGRIYVADAGVQQIVVLSEDAAPVRRIGRIGDAPGEFNDVSSLQVLPGDSLLVLDRQLNRVTLYAPNADRPARTVNLSAASPLPPPFALVGTGDGHLLGEYRDYYRGDDDPNRDIRRRRVFRLLGADGRLLRDSLLVLPEPETSIVVRRDGVVMATPSPFGRRSPWVLAPGDRIVTGWGDSLAVQTFSLDGRRMGGFSRPHRRVELTPGDLNAILEDEPEVFRAAVRQAAPEVWPAFQHLLVDDLGRTWVGVLTPRGEPTRWEVVDTAGRAVCGVDLPESMRIQVVRDDRVFVVATDDLDVPRVVIYQLAGVTSLGRSSVR